MQFEKDKGAKDIVELLSNTKVRCNDFLVYDLFVAVRCVLPMDAPSEMSCAIKWPSSTPAASRVQIRSLLFSSIPGNIRGVRESPM